MVLCSQEEVEEREREGGKERGGEVLAVIYIQSGSVLKYLVCFTWLN